MWFAIVTALVTGGVIWAASRKPNGGGVVAIAAPIAPLASVALLAPPAVVRAGFERPELNERNGIHDDFNEIYDDFNGVGGGDWGQS